MAYLTYLIEELTKAMTSSPREFNSEEQDQCLEDSEKTGDMTLLQFHFDEVNPSLVAQEFT